jgi:hypothetical protein
MITPEAKERYAVAKRAYRQTHLEEARAYDKERCAKNREARRIASKKWNDEHPDYKKNRAIVYPSERRANHLRLIYGLSLSSFDELVAGQGGGCAVCGTVEWGYKGPVVDHDHTTGKVRGVLCSRCNMALGLIDDKPETAQALVGYLQKSK